MTDPTSTLGGSLRGEQRVPMWSLCVGGAVEWDMLGVVRGSVAGEVDKTEQVPRYLEIRKLKRQDTAA